MHRSAETGTTVREGGDRHIKSTVFNVLPFYFRVVLVNKQELFAGFLPVFGLITFDVGQSVEGHQGGSRSACEASKSRKGSAKRPIGSRRDWGRVALLEGRNGGRPGRVTEHGKFV